MFFLGKCIHFHCLNLNNPLSSCLQFWLSPICCKLKLLPYRFPHQEQTFQIQYYNPNAILVEIDKTQTNLDVLPAQTRDESLSISPLPSAHNAFLRSVSLNLVTFSLLLPAGLWDWLAVAMYSLRSPNKTYLHWNLNISLSRIAALGTLCPPWNRAHDFFHCKDKTLKSHQSSILQKLLNSVPRAGCSILLVFTFILYVLWHYLALFTPQGLACVSSVLWYLQEICSFPSISCSIFIIFHTASALSVGHKNPCR